MNSAAPDARQLGTFAAIASLGYVFWVCGAMEMVERLAYYGVRQVSGLYATDATAHGGLGLAESDLGKVFAAWAFTQTFVPVLTGGIADRIGYKRTIAASTVLKICGYLLMASVPTFTGFMCGALVLAFGTGIFKPGIKGTISHVTRRDNSSVAWGIFYQTVNIGGFIGPLLAAQMRQLAWENVFYTCAAIISLNFLLLLSYTEPGAASRARAERSTDAPVEPLWRASLQELRNPLLAGYLALFCGFWFMLMLLWDVGPLYFRDWVDTSHLVSGVFGADGTRSRVAIVLLGLDNTGTRMMPEGLVNLNSMMIMFTCFLVAGWSARLRAANSMALGAALAGAALFAFGSTNGAWIMVAAMVMFSLGEMLSAPKSIEYVSNIAPPDRKAMYLGFSEFAVGVGWTLEGWLGPTLYGEYGSRETIARSTLGEQGLDAATVAAIPQGEAFARLVELSGRSAAQLQNELHAAHDVGRLWFLMGAVGIATAVGLLMFGRWSRRFTG